ncbi:MAG: hypothetical protein NT139_01020 [Candidatus Woesearchaeota archaeon]|nr:hypothetical protein [Candidatus Woesearchaeota archaeon]
MYDEKKIVIGALLILLITMVSFNFLGVTGYNINENSKVTRIIVSPTEIKAGQDLTINIIPGKSGVNRYMNFYEGTIRKGKSGAVCVSSYRCSEPITIVYPTSSLWEPGNYYLQVFDYYSGNYVKADFKVTYPYNLNPKARLYPSQYEK